ncbi:MAG: glycosyltransferase [Phycisphaerae bacterium]|nr:glycosyltransferase [Phycisphaerae bacterium]
MTAVAVILTVLGGLIGLEWALRNCFALHVWRRIFHLTPDSPGYSADHEPPLLSVVVPAKDEESHIGACLQSLLAQDYPNFEILVVDDRSRDRTGEIVEAMSRQHRQIRLLRITELPPGWAGKTHALRQGIAAARGDYLCLTDADGRMSCPRTLSIAMEHARSEKADLLSILPKMVFGGFWEHFLQPLCAGVLVIWFRPERVNDPKRNTAFANGQFLLLRRDAYQAVGTYETLRDSIIEDMDLARKIKSLGRRLIVVPSRGLMAVRMYTSLRELSRGWIRIFLGCFPSVLRLLLTMLVLFLRGLTLTVVTVVGWSMFGAGAEPAGWWLACAITGTVGLAAELVMTARYYHCAGTKWMLGLLYPVGGSIVMSLLFRSLLRRLIGGKVVWKGTHYKTGANGHSPR